MKTRFAWKEFKLKFSKNNKFEWSYFIYYLLFYISTREVRLERTTSYTQSKLLNQLGYSLLRYFL